MTMLPRPTLHTNHDNVIKWKHFPLYWPFVRGIHRSPLNELCYYHRQILWHWCKARNLLDLFDQQTHEYNYIHLCTFRKFVEIPIHMHALCRRLMRCPIRIWIHSTHETARIDYIFTTTQSTTRLWACYHIEAKWALWRHKSLTLFCWFNRFFMLTT